MRNWEWSSGQNKVNRNNWPNVIYVQSMSYPQNVRRIHNCKPVELLWTGHTVHLPIFGCRFLYLVWDVVIFFFSSYWKTCTDLSPSVVFLLHKLTFCGEDIDIDGDDLWSFFSVQQSLICHLNLFMKLGRQYLCYGESWRESAWSGAVSRSVISEFVTFIFNRTCLILSVNSKQSLLTSRSFLYTTILSCDA